MDTTAPTPFKFDHPSRLFPASPGADSFSSSARPLRVALLEHDDALRGQLLPGLRHDGFEVEALRTTGELQQALMSAPFDLCVLDTVFSQGEGVSLPRWLRG